MPTSTRRPAEFMPPVRRSRPIALERQIVNGVRDAILGGRLRAGARLASTREMAHALGVARNTVVSALEQLTAEGYLETVRGSGTFVAAQARPMPGEPMALPHMARWLRDIEPAAISPPRVGVTEFRVCQPSTTHLPLRAWRRAWRHAVHGPPPNDYQDPAGERGLRTAIAEYLGRVRGLACEADDIVITNGGIQAIHLIARATVTPGAGVAFEDPGYPLARQAFARQGARLIHVGVDDDGLRVDDLPQRAPWPLVVYVTPAHQFPLGSRLSMTRRQALLDWAERVDALVVEDDYDSEFRFDAPPLPPLASLDRSGRVAFVGTFSKTLTPALRLGFVKATPALRERLVRLKALEDYHAAAFGQRALDTLIREGVLDRHCNRMRRIYADKRAALLDALRPAGSAVRIRGLEAGLNVFVEIDPHIALPKVIGACAERGVLVHAASEYGGGAHGLVLGYGGLSAEAIRKGARTLSMMLRAGSRS